MQGPGQLIPLIKETTSTECRQDVAMNLLKLFLGQGLAKDFLDLLFQLELSRTSETNTLFRSNSLASKSMESFLKVLRAAPPADRGRGAGAERADAARPPGGPAERAQPLGSRVPRRGARHLPPALRARARALPRRPARECTVHRRHQLPVPALLLSRHHVAQALPPAGAPRGRPHQPHPAPVGQGSPERGQHGHAGFQGQGGLDGAAAAHRAPGRGAAEGLHHQARGHRGEGRAGPAADAEFAGATCEGGATLHPQDQGQGPPHVLLLQEALLLPHYRGPQLREDAQLQGQPQCRRPCAPSGVRSTKCTCRPPSTLWLSTSWMRMPSGECPPLQLGPRPGHLIAPWPIAPPGLLGPFWHPLCSLEGGRAWGPGRAKGLSVWVCACVAPWCMRHIHTCVCRHAGTSVHGLHVCVQL
ncbi:collagen alpha-1(III) chain isoform X4 [Pan troglodytes]